MSCSHDGKILLCDALNCVAQTNAPVTLQSFLTDAPSAKSRWLYVQRNGTLRHYCPLHSQIALLSSQESVVDCTSPARREILLVADNSAPSRESAENVADCLAGNKRVLVTLLFNACVRCMPRSEQPEQDIEIPLEVCCQGTRSAIANLTDIFESRDIPITLQVRSSARLADLISQESSQGKYDSIVVPSSLRKVLTSNFHASPLIVPAGKEQLLTLRKL